MESNDSIRPGILDAFKKLGLETKKDREKVIFGSSTLDESKGSNLSIEYISKYPDAEVKIENA